MRINFSMFCIGKNFLYVHCIIKINQIHLSKKGSVAVQEDWIIRRANLMDIDAINQCVAHSCQKEDRYSFEKDIVDHPVWIAEHHGKLVGCLVLNLEKNLVRVPCIVIDQNFRDQGLRRSFMKFAEREAAKRKCSKLSLSINKKHSNLLSLYEHLGWKDITKSQYAHTATMEKCVNVLLEEI